MKPTLAKPRIIIAQVEGSGTAATAEIVKTSFCPRNGLRRLKLPIVNVGSEALPVKRSVLPLS